MKTPPTEDPELASLIERDLDGDPEARQALDARLAADPDAALAFAQAHRLEALLAEHHAPPARSRFTAFQRPLAWLAVAASLAFLAWAAFHNPAPDPSVAQPTAPSPEPPRRKILSPLRLPSPAGEPRKTTELSATEIEAKASRFFIPEITVNASTPGEALRQIAYEFQSIASSHGDHTADSIRFEALDFDDTTSRPIRFTASGHLRTLLSAVALQSGGELHFGDDRITIRRVRATGDVSHSVIKAFPLANADRLSMLTGDQLPPKTMEDRIDDPFGIPLPELTIGSLVLNEATLREAIDLLKARAIEADPARAGINLALKEPTAPDRMKRRISRDLSGQTIASALASIAEAFDLKAEAREHAFVLAPPDDSIFRTEPVAFALPGLKLSFTKHEQTIAIEGGEALVDAAGANLARFHQSHSQVLVTTKIVCAMPDDLGPAHGAKGRGDLSRGDRILDAPDVMELMRRAKLSRGSQLVSSPSVVTRASQRAKVEVIREILYRVPTEDGSLAVEMIPAGWTLDLDPGLIGEAVRLTGTVEFITVAESPETKDFIGIPDGKIPGLPYDGNDPESLPLGDPTHKWALDFEAELQNGQHALLDFMDLADGKKVYVLIKATLLDPAGQPLIPTREE